MALFSRKNGVGLRVADWAKNHSSNSKSFLPIKKNLFPVTLLQSKFLKYFFLFPFLLESNSLESFFKSCNYFLDSHLLHKPDIHPQQHFPLVLIICSLAFLWGLSLTFPCQNSFFKSLYVFFFALNLDFKNCIYLSTVYLLYNVVLITAVQQSDSVIY